MIDLRSKLADIEACCEGRLSYFDSPVHGIEHLREVALLAGTIAIRIGCDVESAMIAGFLHDCARTTDEEGSKHAVDSAKVARSILEESFPHLDIENICDAIANHADGKVTEDPLSAALWDADRLTLVRLGRKVQPELLSTTVAKQMVHNGYEG